MKPALKPDERDKIELRGNWYLVRCREEGSRNYNDWFLSNPDDVWVAHFWDGPGAGDQDVRAFAKALGFLTDDEGTPFAKN